MYDCMQVKNIYTSQPLEPFKGLLSEMGWVNYPSYLLGLKEKRKNEEWGIFTEDISLGRVKLSYSKMIELFRGLWESNRF